MAKKVVEKKRQFVPIADRVIIKRDVVEKETPGGIVLPEGAGPPVCLGTVVAVGPGKLTEILRGQAIDPLCDIKAMQCEVGDRVVFSPYAETFKLDEEEFVVVHESDLFTILK
jgi:chaperonin GroES